MIKTDQNNEEKTKKSPINVKNEANVHEIILKTKDGEKIVDMTEEIDSGFKYLDGGFRAWLLCAAAVWAFGVNLGLEFNYTLILNEFTIVYNSTEDNVIYGGKI